MAINPNCNIVGIIGGKGGLGKSVFATNLACASLIELRAPTLLIDADQNSCGDLNVLTGIKAPKTLDDLCRYQGSLNKQNLAHFSSQLSQYPLSYIGAVKVATETITQNVQLVSSKLELLSHLFQYIYIDLGNQVSDLQLGLIEQCTGLLMITTPEVLALTQSLKLKLNLNSQFIPDQLIKVVINNASPGGLAPQNIEKNLRLKVIGAVPKDDITAINSIQRSIPFVFSNNSTPIAQSFHKIVRGLTGGILQSFKAVARKKPSPKNHDTEASKGATGNKKLNAQVDQLDPLTSLKLMVHKQLIKEMNLKNDDITKAKNDPQKEKALEDKVKIQIARIIDKSNTGLSSTERRKAIKEVLDEALGLGPLEQLLADNDVSEIMVNGYKKIFFEKSGKIQLSEITFTSNIQLRNVIERIVTPLGRRIDEKTPYVDARLQDGSRVNAIIEPLSIDGPALTIRKFREDAFGAKEYLKYNSASAAMIEFLKIGVSNGLNVVISGGTGSGKTTLLNCLSGFIPKTERIITVEDAAELQLKQEHVVRLETRPANMEGTGAITIRDLVKNTLRMRPDRIVVGECRDGAALDMLSAMNTGHDGSMTTVHSNNARECISRLETLCMMAGMDLPARAIREQIASAVDLIVQISRLSDGSRKLKSITEVQGMQGEAVTLQPVFVFKEKGFDKNFKILGDFQSTGLIPKFIEKLEKRGVKIPKNIFSNETPKAEQPTGPVKKSIPMPTKKKAGGTR